MFDAGGLCCSVSELLPILEYPGIKSSSSLLSSKFVGRDTVTGRNVFVFSKVGELQVEPSEGVGPSGSLQ